MNCYKLYFGLPSFRFNAGFHWYGPVQYLSTRHGGDSHNEGRSPATTNAPGLLGQVMGIHETVLGPGTWLAPEGVRIPPVLAQ